MQDDDRPTGTSGGAEAQRDVFEAPETDPLREAGYWREFFRGVVAWPLVGFPFFFVVAQLGYVLPVLSPIGNFTFFGVGVAQVLFVAPLTGFYLSRRRTARATGLLFVSGLVFGFNALCWGVVLTKGIQIGHR